MAGGLQSFTTVSLLLVALAAVAVAVASSASVHVLLYQRDSRGAAWWLGVVWLVPLLGPALYFACGSHRSRRRALLLRRDRDHHRVAVGVPPRQVDDPERHLGPRARHLTPLLDVVRTVTARPLVAGNAIEPLRNGDEAYPAMWDALERARASIVLATDHFARDAVGDEFAQRLSAAVGRGVAVRVLIDPAGAAPILSVLRRAGVPAARFLPVFSRSARSANLRNHRRILVVDGRVGFAGGLNLCGRHWHAQSPARPVEGVHFKIAGPVVANLREAFADDWYFTTGEALRGAGWFPTLEPEGPAAARGIADGPDEDFEKVRWTLLAAIAAARQSLRIATPYFLPDTAVITALNLAALRGVKVEILLPSSGEPRCTAWAASALWRELLEHGCCLWLTPPPLDATRLFIVDEAWVLVGSGDWTPRSWRRTFEFNLESYDPELAKRLAALFAERRQRAREVTLAETKARRLAVRVRDSVARRFMPIL